MVHAQSIDTANGRVPQYHAGTAAHRRTTAPQKTLLRLGNHIQSQRYARELLRPARGHQALAYGTHGARPASWRSETGVAAGFLDAFEKRSQKHRALGQDPPSYDARKKSAARDQESLVRIPPAR